jgi:hypothetical protein
MNAADRAHFETSLREAWSAVYKASTGNELIRALEKIERYRKLLGIEHNNDAFKAILFPNESSHHQTQPQPSTHPSPA